MPPMQSAVFGYGRVSTNDQSTENQRLELAEAGYAIAPKFWFADQGISGKTPALERPQFRKLLERIREGETLVVSKLDRLGRDSIDVESTLRLLEERLVSVMVLQLGNTDLTSTAGKLIRKVLAAVADMERDLLIERTQAGLARAREQGKVLGRRPKTTPEDRETIRKGLSEGESVSEMARRYGISRATVISIREMAAEA